MAIEAERIADHGRLTRLIEAVWGEHRGEKLATATAMRLATEILGDGFAGPATLAHAEAMAAEARREALEAFAPYLAALPPGEWETWTSCSFRRISRKGGGDGDVLHAFNQRGDGHPDLSWTERECEAICAIVNGLRALIPGARLRREAIPAEGTPEWEAMVNTAAQWKITGLLP